MLTVAHTNGSPLRFGIVGCGAIVREGHLPALVGETNVDVRALCDKNLQNAVLAKKQFALSAATTDRLDEFTGKVDAALVAVPPRFHSRVTIRLLEMGIDVLCEKPLATTSAEAESMIESANRNQRILAVGLMTRFHRSNDVLRALLRGGALGEIREVVAESGAPLDWTMTSASYFMRETTSGGVFFDAGVHLLDRVLWLFGVLSNVEYEDDSYGGVESNGVLKGTLRIDNRDVPCRVALSWTHRLNNSIRVVGALAIAEARLEDPDAVVVTGEIGEARLEMSTRLEPSTSEPAPRKPFQAQIRDFVAAVKERREPFIPAASTVGALKLIEKAYSVRKRMAQPWVDAQGGHHAAV
jgi:predicted dehydrogenase